MNGYHGWTQNSDDLAYSLRIHHDNVRFQAQFFFPTRKNRTGQDSVLGTCLGLVLPQFRYEGVLPSLSIFGIYDNFSARPAFVHVNYRHTVEHDRQQQLRDALSASFRTLGVPPNVDKKPQEQAPKKQPEKEPETPADRSGQQPLTQSPTKAPDEVTKEERKPFTFWGYFPASQGRTAPPGIMFQVRACSIDKTLVTCVMTATSPRYDRELRLDEFGTTITDNDGDVFRVQLRMLSALQLDRDSPVPFKLEFPVNKDLVRPIVVRLNGYVPDSGRLQNAAFRLGQAEP